MRGSSRCRCCHLLHHVSVHVSYVCAGLCAALGRGCGDRDVGWVNRHTATMGSVLDNLKDRPQGKAWVSPRRPIHEKRMASA